MKITIGITDDQQLFLESLSLLIGSLGSFEVTVTALSGEALLKKLSVMQTPPDILLLDVNMPVMDGLAIARAVTARYPLIRIVALSMNDNDSTIINMLKVGSCSYLLKDIHPIELEKALHEIYTRGYYNADAYNIKVRRSAEYARKDTAPQISDREKVFLKLACTDRTYKQIADEMHLSARTIDGYRESLFGKFNVQSRVGMALEAIRRKLIMI